MKTRKTYVCTAALLLGLTACSGSSPTVDAPGLVAAAMTLTTTRRSILFPSVP